MPPLDDLDRLARSKDAEAEIRAPIHVFHGDSDSLALLPILRRTLAGAAQVTEERIYSGGNHLSPWVTRDRQAAMLAIVTG